MAVNSRTSDLPKDQHTFTLCPALELPGPFSCLESKSGPAGLHLKAQAEAEGCWWGTVDKSFPNHGDAGRCLQFPQEPQGLRWQQPLQGGAVHTPCLRSRKSIPAESARTLWIGPFFAFLLCSFHRNQLLQVSPIRSPRRQFSQVGEGGNAGCVNQEDRGQREGKCYLHLQSYPERWVESKVRPEF